MNHNYPLQNNFNNSYESNFINNGFNGYSDNLQSTNITQSSSNVFYNNTNSSSGPHTVDLTSNNIVPTSTVINEQHSTYSTTVSPYAPPYTGNEQNQNLQN